MSHYRPNRRSEGRLSVVDDELPRTRRTLTGIADQAETALHRANRRVLTGVIVAAVLALAFAGAAFTVSVSTTRSENAINAAERVAARTAAGREQLAQANAARGGKGLPVVPDPGSDASPDVVWLAAARAWGGVDAADLIAQRGAAGASGVTTPGSSGPFPGR